jgi:hypothetical protein
MTCAATYTRFVRCASTSGSHQTRRWREPDSNHRSRGIGGRFEGNTGIHGRMARGAARTQALPKICHGILSLQGTVKRWIGGQFFEPVRSPDTLGATSRMKHSIDRRSWPRLRLPWRLI